MRVQGRTSWPLTQPFCSALAPRKQEPPGCTINCNAGRMRLRFSEGVPRFRCSGAGALLLLPAQERPTPLKWRTWRRARFMEQPERYFDYFASRLKPPQIRLTGDITPSYAGLKRRAISASSRPSRNAACKRGRCSSCATRWNGSCRSNACNCASVVCSHPPMKSSTWTKPASSCSSVNLHGTITPRPSMPCGADWLNRRSSSASTKPCSQQQHIALCRHLGIPEQIPD